MLDMIMMLAADVLNITNKEVRDAREKLETELSEDDARYAARTQLAHPKGSSTPLNGAADRAQQAYDRVRNKVAKEVPKMMALMMAQEVAERRRDETAAARDRQWEASRDRLESGVHPETRDLFGRLFEHGVTPWHLKAMSNEDVAIVADLIRWKAGDARYHDEASPWRQVLPIYAGRLILKAGKGTKVRRSVVGTPVHPVRYTDPKHYMFNEMVDPSWAADHASPAPAAATGQPASTPVVSAAEASEPMASVIAQPPAVENMETEESGSGEIDEARAKEMAELIYQRTPLKLGIYWPDEGIDRHDYDLERLIPALERMVASADSWSGAVNFLEPPAPARPASSSPANVGQASLSWRPSCSLGKRGHWKRRATRV